MKEYKKPKYLIATTAIHQLGDISRPTGDLAQITGYDSENYYGMWVCGFGFFGVKFPRSTTRELNKKEIKYWQDRTVGIPGSWHYKLKVK